MGVTDEGGKIQQHVVSLPKSLGSSLDAKQPCRQVIMHEIGVADVISAVACTFSRDCTHKTHPIYMQHRQRVEFQTKMDQIKSSIADPRGLGWMNLGRA